MPLNEGDNDDETDEEDDGDVEHIDKEGEGETAEYIGEEGGGSVVNTFEYISDGELDSEQNCCSACVLIGCKPFVENGIVEAEHPVLLFVLILLFVSRESPWSHEIDVVLLLGILLRARASTTAGGEEEFEAEPIFENSDVKLPPLCKDGRLLGRIGINLLNVTSVGSFPIREFLGATISPLMLTEYLLSIDVFASVG